MKRIDRLLLERRLSRLERAVCRSIKEEYEDGQKVNIMVGRFQPFTTGHLYCVNEAYNRTGLKTVILCIETPEHKRDKRHPFSTDMLRESFRKLKVENNNILDVIYVKNANLVANSAICIEHGYLIAGWTCGSDRAADYSRMSRSYSSSVTDDFELIEVARVNEDTSATKVRQSILDDDIDYFRSHTPKALWNSYPEFKLALEEIYI